MAKHQDKMGDEDEDDFMELEALLSEGNANDRSWPGEVYAYVKLQYDSTLKNKLAADGTDFNTWADAVMTHVQTHYRHTSLPTKIQFKVLYNNMNMIISMFDEWIDDFYRCSLPNSFPEIVRYGSNHS